MEDRVRSCQLELGSQRFPFYLEPFQSVMEIEVFTEFPCQLSTYLGIHRKNQERAKINEILEMSRNESFLLLRIFFYFFLQAIISLREAADRLKTRIVNFD